jgi:hypothetical protein
MSDDTRARSAHGVFACWHLLCGFHFVRLGETMVPLYSGRITGECAYGSTALMDMTASQF